MRGIAVCIAILALTAPALAKGPKKASRDNLEARIAALEAELARRPKDVSAYSLPREVEFCGQKIDTRAPRIRERIEKEFLLVLGDRAQVVLWARRSGRVFPAIEEAARGADACTDLKYLAVIESGLRPAVTSHASAHGWWQFVAGTAREYGLSMSDSWDQRADLHAASRAGVRYLTALHDQFGDWMLAAAAYNTGPGRLQRAIEAQGTNDYWRLDLYSEAERYVPRMLAVKAVLENLEGYGFEHSKEDEWPAVDRGYVKVRIPKGRELPVLAAARGTDIDYRMLRALNPELRGDLLPTGDEVVVEVPAGKEPALRGWLADELAKRPAVKKRASKRAKGPKAKPSKRAKSRKAKPSKRAKSRKSKPRRYTIRPGDSLWSIADRYGVSVEQLRGWNKLSNRSVLQPGQRLVVGR